MDVLIEFQRNKKSKRHLQNHIKFNTRNIRFVSSLWNTKTSINSYSIISTTFAQKYSDRFSRSKYYKDIIINT